MKILISLIKSLKTRTAFCRCRCRPQSKFAMNCLRVLIYCLSFSTNSNRVCASTLDLVLKMHVRVVAETKVSPRYGHSRNVSPCTGFCSLQRSYRPSPSLWLPTVGNSHSFITARFISDGHTSSPGPGALCPTVLAVGVFSMLRDESVGFAAA